jgi:hypothetical protein
MDPGATGVRQRTFPPNSLRLGSHSGGSSSLVVSLRETMRLSSDRTAEAALIACVAAVAASVVTRAIASDVAFVAVVMAVCMVAVGLFGWRSFSRRGRAARSLAHRLSRVERELQRLQDGVVTIDEDRLSDVIEAGRREGMVVRRATGRDVAPGLITKFRQEHGDGSFTIHEGYLAPGQPREGIIDDLRKQGLRLDGIEIVEVNSL